MRPRDKERRISREVNRGNVLREMFEKFIAFLEKENAESENEDGYREVRIPNRS
jgi:hypothetical protein